MRATFVVPCYNEEGNVSELYEAFVQAFAHCPISWGLVMVDDGSRDETYVHLEALAKNDPRVTVVRFSRNFGKEAAIYAGLAQAAKDSDYVGVIDADLQQPPSVALDMLQILINHEQYDCVAAYQSERREGWLVSRLKGQFYRVFAKAARSTDMVANASDFRVFRRSVAEALLSMPEYYRFSKGLFAWVGFTTYAYPYVPEERLSGASKWSITSLFKYAMGGIVSFSTRPLRLITVLGLLACLIALVYAIVVIVKTLAFGVDVPGYASLATIVLLLGGAQLLSLGVIGEYLARVYIEGKHRPVYIVKTVLNSRDHKAMDDRSNDEPRS